MKRTKQDYHNLIQETVEYYGENPLDRRGLDNRGCCRYYTKGKMCAVGRCLIDAKAVETNVALETLSELNSRIGLEKNLKEQYKGFEIDFWINLQKLHDYSKHWDGRKGGLTKSGLAYVEVIKNEIEKIIK